MKKLLMGVDVGASNIKIVGMKEKRDSYVVHHALIAPTPPMTVVEGAVMDHGAVSKTITEMISKAKGIEKEIAIALKGDDVVVKTINVPWNGKGNFAEEFAWSAEQYIGMREDQMSFDVQTIAYDIETLIAKVVVAAASKDKVSDMLNVVSESGLKPIVVDIEALALVNLINENRGKQKHVNTIIDIGYDSVRLIFFEKGNVDTVKSIPKGGKFLASDLASDLSIDLEKAEEMIRDKEIMSNDADAQAAAMAYGNSLGSEIETTVDIYMQERGKEPVDFYICGALSEVAEIIENIETSMGASVIQIDPFKNIELPDAKKSAVEECGAATFALAVSLAMRKA